MSTAEVRAATINLPATAKVLVHLPDDTYVEVVGYFSANGNLVLETILAEEDYLT